jgi:hypothetical protein
MLMSLATSLRMALGDCVRSARQDVTLLAWHERESTCSNLNDVKDPWVVARLMPDVMPKVKRRKLQDTSLSTGEMHLHSLYPCFCSLPALCNT